MTRKLYEINGKEHFLPVKIAKNENNVVVDAQIETVNGQVSVVEPYELLSEVDERGCVSIYSDENEYFDFCLGDFRTLVIEGEGF